MTTRRRVQISTRKQPQQVRSAGLVQAIMQAAIKVLEDEGVPRFTTARVAEKAGVSIGSVYQYFPNKAAILFQLQVNEWRATTAMLRVTLEDADRPPLDRLRTLVHRFLESECAEAAMRGALNDAARLYRDAPEAQEIRDEGDRALEAFMVQLLPGVDTATRALAGDLITTTFSSVGSSFSETPHTAMEIKNFADAMANMFCAYVRHLQNE